MNIANATTHPIARASRAYKGGGSSPERDLYNETSGELRAKLDLAPRMLAAEAEFRPLYQSLEMQGLQDLLMGTQGGTRTFDYTEMVPTGNGQRGNGFSIGPGGRPVLGQSGPTRMQTVNRSRTVNVPGSRGLLDFLENDILPASDRMTAQGLTRQRESEISDVEQLGGRATAAWRAANPEQAQLLAELNKQAQEELALGATLDPSLRREVMQSIRSGQAARGMGLGLNDLADEAFGTGMAAEQLRQSRRGFATQMAGVNQATSIDPFLATLGRPALNAGQSNNLLGQSRSINAGLGPQLFGSGIDASDVYDFNANAAAARQISGGNNQAAMWGAGAGVAGAAIIAL